MKRVLQRGIIRYREKRREDNRIDKLGEDIGGYFTVKTNDAAKVDSVSTMPIVNQEQLLERQNVLSREIESSLQKLRVIIAESESVMNQINNVKTQS